MRKSYIFSMAIVLVALVGMMLAADMALKPMKQTIAISGDVTAMLEARGDLQPDTKVLVLTRKAGKQHLAEDGFGMILELSPSDAVRTRQGRLERLALRVIHESGRLYEQGRGKSVAWYEVRFLDGDDVWHRTLFSVGKAGQLEAAQPAIPPVWVASAR